VPSEPAYAPSSALENVVEDDDTLAVPSVEQHRLARKPESKPSRRVPYTHSLHFRQTIIPPLLTLGVGLLVMSAGWFMLDSDTPVRSLSIGYPIGLALIGLVSLGLAAANMLSVKAQLQRPVR
jgi:hypothetical protein